jgi:hypothetical protein
MRDLTSKLRAIVRTPVPARREAPPVRELTYEPDLGFGGSPDAEATADRLGGTVTDGVGGRFVSVDRTWDGHDWHGQHRVSSFRLAPDAPVAMLDPRLAADGLLRKPVFFDIETTGLSGGAGTIAFLVGCGWFEDDGFRVRQFFLTGPAGEPALLDALAEVFRDASMLVTYNGRTFDIPTMELRWAFHRKASGADDVPHFDMLPPARRFWGRVGTGRQAEDGSSCSLTSLERSQLGFHRIGDVPGFEIPVRYFHYLRTGDAAAVEDVLQHNRLDLISLAAVASRALQLVADDRALQAFELAARGRDLDVRAHALARVAVLLRRLERYDEAASAWEEVLNGRRRGLVGMSPLERRAAEALAIHHEHRARDLETARRYAEQLRGASGRQAADLQHRLERLERKLKRAGDTTGGQEAARLFDESTPGGR